MKKIISVFFVLIIGFFIWIYTKPNADYVKKYDWKFYDGTYPFLGDALIFTKGTCFSINNDTIINNESLVKGKIISIELSKITIQSFDDNQIVVYSNKRFD